jgi:hypothetical protein
VSSRRVYWRRRGPTLSPTLAQASDHWELACSRRLFSANVTQQSLHGGGGGLLLLPTASAARVTFKCVIHAERLIPRQHTAYLERSFPLLCVDVFSYGAKRALGRPLSHTNECLGFDQTQ